MLLRKIMQHFGTFCAFVSGVFAAGMLCTLSIYEPTPPQNRAEE